MAKLKSLSSGLAGAKRAGEATTKALRKLFGRQDSGSASNSLSRSESVSAVSDGNGNGNGNGNSGHNNNRGTGSDEAAAAASGSSTGQAQPGEQLTSASDGNVNHKPSLTSTQLPRNTSDAAEVASKSTETQQKQSTAQDDPSAMQTPLVSNKLKENRPPGSSTSQKENEPPKPSVDNIVSGVSKLDLQQTSPKQQPEILAPTTILPVTPVEEEPRPLTPDELLSPDERAFRQERRKHLVFIEEALDMARLALKINETPVGCVLVHDDKVIARGMNATNVTRNGTRHAEFMALCALLSYAPKNGPKTTSLKPRRVETDDGLDDDASVQSPQPDEGNEDGSKGHLYPYGQKEVPDERVDRRILTECTLYVTVEPCVMCASLLRQVGIKKVFFGAVNDKFGGTGGVFSIHANSLPVRDDGQTASAHPQPPPMRLPDGKQVLGTSFPVSGGDGGNVEPGYEIEGGWGRDEAVGLLRRFYVQENGRAPVPRKKEGRAARLQAMMDGDGDNESTNETNESGSGGNGTVSDSYDTNNADSAQKHSLEGEDSSRSESSHTRLAFR